VAYVVHPVRSLAIAAVVLLCTRALRGPVLPLCALDPGSVFVVGITKYGLAHHHLRCRLCTKSMLRSCVDGLSGLQRGIKHVLGKGGTFAFCVPL
jgi:hypothetical protein